MDQLSSPKGTVGSLHFYRIVERMINFMEDTFITSTGMAIERAFQGWIFLQICHPQPLPPRQHDLLCMTFSSVCAGESCKDTYYSTCLSDQGVVKL